MQGTIGGHAMGQSQQPEDQVTAHRASTAREYQKQAEEGSRQGEAQVALAWRTAPTALRADRALSVCFRAQMVALGAGRVHVAEVSLSACATGGGKGLALCG